MHTQNSAQCDEDMELLRDKPHSLSTFWVVELFMGSSIYTSAMQMGNVFGCGLLLSVILSFLFGVIAYYTLWMLRSAMIETRCNSGPLIWKKFSEKTIFVPCLMVAIPCIGNCVYLFFMDYQMFVMLLTLIDQKILESMPPLTEAGFPNTSTIPSFLKDYFIMSFVIALVVLLGIFIRQDFHYFRLISSIKIFVILGLLIIQIIHLFQKGISKEISAVRATPANVFNALDTLMTVYAILIFYYPIISQLSRITAKRVDTVNKWSMIFVVTVETLFGIIQYLDLGENYTSGFVFLYYEPGSYVQIFTVFLGFLLSILTLPMIFYPCIQSVLGAIQVIRPFPKEVWGLTGITIAIVCVFLGKLEGEAFLYFFFIIGFFSALISYIFPMIFFVKTQKHISLIHIICCIGLAGFFILYCAAHIINYYKLV